MSHSRAWVLTGQEHPDHEAARDDDMALCMASRMCKKPWDCHHEQGCRFVADVDAHDARRAAGRKAA